MRPTRPRRNPVTQQKMIDHDRSAGTRQLLMKVAQSATMAKGHRHWPWKLDGCLQSSSQPCCGSPALFLCLARPKTLGPIRPGHRSLSIPVFCILCAIGPFWETTEKREWSIMKQGKQARVEETERSVASGCSGLTASSRTTCAQSRAEPQQAALTCFGTRSGRFAQACRVC